MEKFRTNLKASDLGLQDEEEDPLDGNYGLLNARVLVC